jgi:hypothetical protein
VSSVPGRETFSATRCTLSAQSKRHADSVSPDWRQNSAEKRAGDFGRV